MSENVESNIPTEIKLYLDEISERLWSGHAAVMVGAGFSKNAKKSNPATKGFPEWKNICSDDNEFAEVRNSWNED